jgi:hypothetical protein
MRVFGRSLAFLGLMDLQRSHVNRIECSVSENSPHCTVSIRFKNDREDPAGFLEVREWTLEQAQAFADDAVRSTGHVCTSACGGWKWFLTAP